MQVEYRQNGTDRRREVRLGGGRKPTSYAGDGSRCALYPDALWRACLLRNARPMLVPGSLASYPRGNRMLIVRFSFFVPPFPAETSISLL